MVAETEGTEPLLLSLRLAATGVFRRIASDPDTESRPGEAHSIADERAMMPPGQLAAGGFLAYNCL